MTNAERIQEIDELVDRLFADARKHEARYEFEQERRCLDQASYWLDRAGGYAAS